MNYNTTEPLRKTSSGLGFMLFAASLTMYAMSLVAGIFLYKKMDTTSLLLLDVLISIVGLFIVGLFYCWFSKTDPGSVIRIKWIKLNLAVPLILAGLTVAFTADYLTDLLQSSFAVFGVENNIDLSVESRTLLENIINIVAVSVIPPLVEEFLFRGIVLGKLRFFGDAFALFLSSALFALMHGNIIQIPFAFIVGLVLAFLTIRTGSLVPSMVVHFIVNFRSVLISILLDNKAIDENVLNNIYLISLFVVFVLGIISAAILSRKKGFFKLSSREDIPFREAVKSSMFSAGIIVFVIYIVLTTFQTISISWLGFSKYMF